MNDDRLLEPRRETYLPREDFPLAIPWREIVVVVEARLADRHGPLVRQEVLEPVLVSVLPCPGLVGMEADRGVDAYGPAGACDLEVALRVGEARRRRQDLGDAGLKRPVEDQRNLPCELIHREMGVGVHARVGFNARHFTTLPGGTSSSKVAMIGDPAASAARIIPWDSTPLSFAGLRLATMMTVLPTRLSGAYFTAIPATTVRTSVPMSTVSFRSRSAPATFSAVMTLPALRRIFWKSSIVI